MKRHKKAFTLIEWLIVITLLMIAAVAISISIQSAVKDQRFRTEARLVVDVLQLAQDLMLLLNVDGVVRFEENPQEKTIDVIYEPVDLIKETWLPLVNRSRLILHTIDNVNLKLEEQIDPRIWGKQIVFFSGGSVMTQGTLTLSAGDYRQTIILLGYPSPFRTGNRPSEWDRQRDLEDLLTRGIMQEFPETDPLRQQQQTPSEQPVEEVEQQEESEFDL
ncbi:MAG: type II secretion system protein [Chlamydiia bacterium]|nr:type II secretion system protein [Chlamydiia bacterium]